MPVLGFVILLLLSACHRAEYYAPSDSFLIDQPRLLNQAQSNRIKAYHQQLLEDLDIHFKLVILNKTPANIDKTAAELFQNYLLGNQTRGAKGLLLLIDPEGHQARIETGRDLESIYPDAFVSYIQREQMARFYERGRVADGIESTVELLVARAVNAIDADAYDPKSLRTRLSHQSGGGGARASLHTHAQERDERFSPAAYGAQASVDMAFSIYLHVLESGVKDSRLEIYSDHTQMFLDKRLVTDAQQQNELAEIQAVYDKRRIREQGSLAVIDFPGSSRVPPYFFRKAPRGWTIDLSIASRLIGFNHLNQWYIRDHNNEFSFAF